MRIGELARRAGVSERALRYYERQGLVRPARLPSGYREYVDADVTTVRHIRTLLAAGLSTTMIAEVLPCMVDLGDGLAPGCPELLPHFEGERDRISAAIRELETARSLLEKVIAATPPAADDPALSAPRWSQGGQGETRYRPRPQWRGIRQGLRQPPVSGTAAGQASLPR
ncbi:MerR family transcriptional regulator [Actinokineospora iranica]|uniref:DNA-binding transcriptional regulator, MerR family n=1 Tax=Actinokineospora iranica TaxID=1271860 RepID=A0A1G6J3W6_9PSEU|nr:MerR family transcriptional regulator [Actinokineospora iranica]SDC12666.1 DNA-binding transcriptional regulator, MerR family [Actinokineospora iranica]